MTNAQLESHGEQALARHVSRNRHPHRVSLPGICKSRYAKILKKSQHGEAHAFLRAKNATLTKMSKKGQIFVYSGHALSYTSPS